MDGLVPARRPNTCDRQTPRIVSQAAGGVMAGKMQDREFRYPDTAAYLQGLAGEEATKQPPMIRKADGVFTEYWCEGGRVRYRQQPPDRLPRMESFPRRSRPPTKNPHDRPLTAHPDHETESGGGPGVSAWRFPAGSWMMRAGSA